MTSLHLRTRKSPPFALYHLLDAVAAHPKFGILIPLQITEDGRDVDPKFAVELKKYAPAELLADHVLGEARKAYPVPVLPGAAMLVQGEVVMSGA